MTMAEAREDLGIEQRKPTPEEQYEKRKAELEAIVAKYPMCTWAANELKFLEVDDFEEAPYRRPLAMDRGRRGMCDAAVAGEMRYNGTGEGWPWSMRQVR